MAFRAVQPSDQQPVDEAALAAQGAEPAVPHVAHESAYALSPLLRGVAVLVGVVVVFVGVAAFGQPGGWILVIQGALCATAGALTCAFGPYLRQTAKLLNWLAGSAAERASSQLGMEEGRGRARRKRPRPEGTRGGGGSGRAATRRQEGATNRQKAGRIGDRKRRDAHLAKPGGVEAQASAPREGSQGVASSDFIVLQTLTIE